MNEYVKIFESNLRIEGIEWITEPKEVRVCEFYNSDKPTYTNYWKFKVGCDGYTYVFEDRHFIILNNSYLKLTDAKNNYLRNKGDEE